MDYDEHRAMLGSTRLDLHVAGAAGEKSGSDRSLAPQPAHEVPCRHRGEADKKRSFFYGRYRSS